MKLSLIKLSLLLFFATNFVYAQTSENKIFDSVPKPTRESLVDALNQVIEFERNQNWASIYPFLTKPVSFYDKKNVNQDEYVKEMKKYTSSGFIRLLEFKPESVAYNGDETDGFALIFGCGKYKDGSSKPKYKSQAEVVLIKGEWQFSATPKPSVGIDSGAPRCKESK